MQNCGCFHIQVADNGRIDVLSRTLHDFTEQNLNARIFKNISSQLGKPWMYISTRRYKQFKKHDSSRQPKPTAIEINSFCQYLTKRYFCLLLFFIIISCSFSNVLLAKATALIVLAKSTIQYWCWQLLQTATGDPICPNFHRQLAFVTNSGEQYSVYNKL